MRSIAGVAAQDFEERVARAREALNAGIIKQYELPPDSIPHQTAQSYLKRLKTASTESVGNLSTSSLHRKGDSFRDTEADRTPLQRKPPVPKFSSSNNLRKDVAAASGSAASGKCDTTSPKEHLSASQIREAAITMQLSSLERLYQLLQKNGMTVDQLFGDLSEEDQRKKLTSIARGVYYPGLDAFKFKKSSSNNKVVMEIIENNKKLAPAYEKAVRTEGTVSNGRMYARHLPTEIIAPAKNSHSSGGEGAAADAASAGGGGSGSRTGSNRAVSPARNHRIGLNTVVLAGSGTNALPPQRGLVVNKVSGSREHKGRGDSQQQQGQGTVRSADSDDDGGEGSGSDGGYTTVQYADARSRMLEVIRRTPLGNVKDPITLQVQDSKTLTSKRGVGGRARGGAGNRSDHQQTSPRRAASSPIPAGGDITRAMNSSNRIQLSMSTEVEGAGAGVNAGIDMLGSSSASFRAFGRSGPRTMADFQKYFNLIKVRLILYRWFHDFFKNKFIPLHELFILCILTCELVILTYILVSNHSWALTTALW